jgi:hypothetical protein
MVEKHFNISIAPVRSRGGSLVMNIALAHFWSRRAMRYNHKCSYVTRILRRSVFNFSKFKPLYKVLSPWLKCLCHIYYDSYVIEIRAINDCYVVCVLQRCCEWQISNTRSLGEFSTLYRDETGGH